MIQKEIEMPFQPLQWFYVSDPQEAAWVQWNRHEPAAGEYVWIRDETDLVYDIAWALGTPGNISVVLAADSTMTRLVSDEWQRIKLPF